MIGRYPSTMFGVAGASAGAGDGIDGAADDCIAAVVGAVPGETTDCVPEEGWTNGGSGRPVAPPPEGLVSGGISVSDPGVRCCGFSELSVDGELAMTSPN